MQAMTEIQTPVLYPAVQEFLDKLAAHKGPPLQELSPQEARRVLRGLQAGPVMKFPADIEDRVLPVGPGGKVSVRIVRPQGERGLLPVVMYFHGGGWVMGDQDTHDRLIREIAYGTGAAVVFVNYTPSPEAQYPVPIEQAYAATEWVARHGKEINVDGSHLALAGDSVGGNMTAAVSLLVKERGGFPIAFQVLFYPVTDAGFDTPSYEQFAEGHFLTRESMKWFWDQYAPDPAVRSEPTASPLQAPVDQLRGLPPALIIVDECDVLRDEGEAYARKLIEADVDVTALRCLGITHDFVMLNALTETPAARTAIAVANGMLRAYLGGE